MDDCLICDLYAVIDRNGVLSSGAIAATLSVSARPVDVRIDDERHDYPP